MDYLGIAAIIVVVVVSVHFVHRHAYNAGIKFGKDEGRLEILKENVLRIDQNREPVFQELHKHINQERRRVVNG